MNDSVDKRVADLERRVADLERRLQPQYVPQPYTLPTNQCAVCGIKFEGAWGYVCNHPNCPTRITCTSITL